MTLPDGVADSLKQTTWAPVPIEHEAWTGQADRDWSEGYAEYMVREQAGRELPV